MDFTEKLSLGTGISHQLQETSPSNLVLSTSGHLDKRGAKNLLTWSVRGERSKDTHCGNTKIPSGGMWKTDVSVLAMIRGLSSDFCKDRDRVWTVPKVMALTRLEGALRT